ncbi:MAG: class I SAM-dependent methyltransferase [Candidatus Micrarchaeota archaeon]|nr:class I SAM-dependent methyltransferase [Candidatus Micrarchaeota archaeon]
MLARSPYDAILASSASEVLKSQYQRKRPKSMEALVDFAMNFDYRGLNFKPFQVRSEIAGLLKLVKERKPKVILEIGTAKGGTLFLFSKVAPRDARIISLDFPLYPMEKTLRKWRFTLFKSFADQSQKMYILWRDSHRQSTLQEIKDLLGGAKVDFLFIDGDHRYEGVKKDFEMYSPLVSKDGLIAFHDVVKHPPEQHSHVDEYFDQLGKRYKTIRIVENEKQGWGGIGVIKMGSN